MSSDKGMGLYMPQTFGNLRSNLKEYERLNTNCVNLRLQKYKLEWEIPKLSVKTKKLCLARDGIRAQSILIARSLAAVFNPVVQMTAFKQPVYCAQFPAAFQD
jgi:hypothetical protein